MTEPIEFPAELVPVLRRLPPLALDQLRRGPIRATLDQLVAGQHPCRVCDALFGMVDAYLGHRTGALTTYGATQLAAAVRIHDWHQAILADSVAHLPDLIRGPVAYQRCLAIYRAAGWTG